MSRAFDFILVLGALTLGAGTWWGTHSWWRAGLVAVGVALLGFGKKIWSELEPQWAKRIATWTDNLVLSFFARYNKRYSDHLYYKHRTFDVKGLSTQGKFALELETVYIELGVEPASLANIRQDPIGLPSTVERNAQRNVFDWLGDKSQGHCCFALLGPPGSGKTTLLKHLTLVLAAGRGPLRLTPVLLFLREHYSTIEGAAEVKLTQLIESTLKDLQPPVGWFESRLKRGRCLVMFDGLDEIAESERRRKIAQWVERQVEVFGANKFLVASRPNGYKENALPGFTVLQVLKFGRREVEHFVRNWYLANELAAHRKDDPGVRMAATEGADDLLGRLRKTPRLQDMAVNPLLLTLIATVHRYRSELPGRRVELFAEICDVFLGKRQQARGVEISLTPAQKVRVLRVLAYEMMRRGVRELFHVDAIQIIAETLQAVMPSWEPSAFLQMVEDSSGLLLQRENGIYGFAHLTFQEYLASVHIKEEKLALELAECVDQPWWHETARLYAAQADASPIVEKCLFGDRPKLEALLLASHCDAEALELRVDLRERLQRITDQAIEDEEPERRRLAAEHKLVRRIREEMILVDEDRYLDKLPLSHSEYQLFIDESRSSGQFRQPDHWNGYTFPKNSGNLPIVGIGKRDAEAFCAWVSAKTFGEWSFSLPEETALSKCDTSQWKDLRFFTKDRTASDPKVPGKVIVERLQKDRGGLVLVDPRLSRREIADRIKSDVRLTLRRRHRRSRGRLILLLLWVAMPHEPRGTSLFLRARKLFSKGSRSANRKPKLDQSLLLEVERALDRALGRHFDPYTSRTLAQDVAQTFNATFAGNRELVRDFARDLARALDGAVVGDLALDQTDSVALYENHPLTLSELASFITVDGVSDLGFDRNLEAALTRELDLDLDRARALNGALARFLALDLLYVDAARAQKLARDLEREPDKEHDLNRCLITILLNRLCVAEKRADGSLPLGEGLWLARSRSREALDR